MNVIAFRLLPIFVCLMVMAACSNKPLTHKLVVTGGEQSVPLYPDEATYLKISQREQQGGVKGMIGNAQENLSAKQIKDQTPVNIVSSDSNGSEVEIVDGPMKGTRGFVANQNVD